MFDFFEKCLNWLQEIFHFISNAFTVLFSSVRAVVFALTSMLEAYPLFQSLLILMPSVVASVASLFVVFMILRFLLLK